jgi:uroporphyrin-III C-methyltransferase/precorrin-2 dehydrogenase/sirohydrochlorin ferrochelatase
MSLPLETPPKPPERPPAFPLFLSLAGEHAVVIGGGSAASTKVTMLRRAGARVTVVAERLDEELASLAAAGEVEHAVARDVSPLDGARLCIAAVDDPAVARRWRDEARKRGVLFNAVDTPELCDFIVPAMVERGPMQVAISTGGLAPALARDLRGRIEAAVPAAYGGLARWCGRWRRAVADAVPKALRRRFWDAVLDGPEAEAALAGDEADADRRLAARLARPPRAGAAAGRVSLVGAGPGDAELLTLRAARLIRRADVVLYDKLVGSDVLAMARRDARLVDVGKRCGRHALSQEAINRLLVEHARRGAHVVRLKGGDPFVFGRGGEELDWLRSAGVPADIVPGVTAATAAAARLGIPLTHRGISRALHLVTGHGADDSEVALDWPALARPGATLAIYMGARTLPRIAERLAEAGLPTATPTVAIENATRPDERVCRGTLAEVAARVADGDFSGPMLVVLGEVVALGAAERSQSLDRDSAEARAA